MKKINDGFSEKEIEAWSVLKSIQNVSDLNEEQKTLELKKLVFLLREKEETRLSARCG